jgi:molybdopterin/thiamine biosynthesis adenylyltransferase
MTNDWLARQSFLGKEGDAILTSLKVAVIGLGGGGSHVVQQLAHLGVGQFVLMDRDRIDQSNLNRLVGGTVADVAKRRLKTAIAHRSVRRVNPAATVSIVSDDWRKKAELLRDCDIIVGCVDTYATRAELEVVARRFLIPYVDIGMDVHAIGERFFIAGQVILSMPGHPCMRCIGFLNDKLLAQEAARYNQAGSRPQVVWPNGVLASLAVGVVVQLFTPWHDHRDELVYLEYDGNKQTVVESNLLSYAPPRCNHFSGFGNIGDPWFQMRR